MIAILIVTVHIIVALALILIVLLQVGKGGSLGAAFGGGGSSQTLFGSRGPATFLSQLTAVAAANLPQSRDVKPPPLEVIAELQARHQNHLPQVRRVVAH